MLDFATEPPQLHGVFVRQRVNPRPSALPSSPCIGTHHINHNSTGVFHWNLKMAVPGSMHGLLDNINTIAAFLAHNQIPSLSTCDQVDCIIICASSVLYQASYVLQAIQDRPSMAKTLVLVGGIGHSTNLIYDAVARHPEYRKIKNDGDVIGLPESHVLQRILDHSFDIASPDNGGPKVLIEDHSTNCGANAVETRKVLERNGITGPLSCIVVQDPTMSLRTIASFEKAYEDLPVAERPIFKACPVFVPETRMESGMLEYVVEVKDQLRDELKLRREDLWEKQRFCELLVGEVTRLKDDENGYGPNGKRFIGHVDVPDGVVQAARRVKEVFGTDR